MRCPDARNGSYEVRTDGCVGVYKSMMDSVESALEGGLEHLAHEFNLGKQFPQNVGGFCQGQPLGSGFSDAT